MTFKMEPNGTVTEDFDPLAARAESALSNGDWATAAVAYEELLRARPKQTDLRYKLARAYDELGRLQDAIEVLSHPSIAGREKTNRRLVKTYIAANNYEAAIPLVDELIAESPDNPKFTKWKAICEGKAADDSPIAKRIEQAQALVSTDDLEEAEQIYLQLLAENPELGRAYLHLGQIYAVQTRWADAISTLRAGLAVDPGSSKLRASLARALFKSGEPAEAVALLNRLDGGAHDIDSLFLLQRCHMELCDWLRASETGARLLAILSPDNPLRERAAKLRQDALVEKAAAKTDAIAKSGDFDRLIADYRRLAERYPQSALAWLKLGTTLADCGRDEEAAPSLREGLRLHPEDAELRRALTRVVVKTSEEPEVLRYVQDAIAAGNADFDSYRWLARYHADRNDWPASLENARSALAIDASSGSARMLLIRALIHLGHLADALDELDALISVGAKRVEALQLKADISVRLARLDEAIDLYRVALDAAPKHPLISHSLSSAFLLNGDIEGFHRFHEKRRELDSFTSSEKERPFQDWNGELSIEGKLLVWSENGFNVGQNILHMAVLEPLVGLGLDIVLQVEPCLVEMCRRSFPDISIVANDEKLPAGISHHSPIGSLSRWFKPDLASFDSMRPYLVPDVEAVAAYRERMQRAAGGGQLLIGVSWEANPGTVPLDQLLNAIAAPGVTLIDLQGGDLSQFTVLAEAKGAKLLLDSGIAKSDALDGLLALVAAMDFVVSTDNVAAYVAGAVGAPTFVLLPPVPAPHWLAQGERSIWYPGMRLIRQAPIDAGWDVGLARLGEAVSDFADGYDSVSWLAGTLVKGLRPSDGRARSMSPQEIRDAIRAFVAQGAFAQTAYHSALELISRLPSDHLSREVQMQRGDLLVRFGHWGEARAAYVSLRSNEGSDAEIDRQILSVSLAMHDLEYALPIARHLADQEAPYRLVVANILYLLRRNEEALAELRAASLETPQVEGLSTLLGTLLLEMREFERAETYLADQAAMRRRTEDYMLLGRSISAQGRHEEALAVYNKGIALSEYDPADNIDVAAAAASFWRTQERVECGVAPLVPLPPLLGDIPNVTQDDVVLFFVADSTYFWQHALVVLGSLGRRSPRAKCHVHVINPDAGVARAVEIIGRMLPDLRLSYSYEHADFGGCGDAHIRTYYASVRFVRLAEIFAESPAFYLCVDADSIVRDNIEAQASGLEIADVGIRMRYDERPHMTVAAGALMLRPTAAAAKFIDQVSRLIRRTLEAREAVWFLDQIVLSHVLRELGESEVGVSQLDMTYIDWFFRDHSVIWTGKGPRKSEDNRYTDEVSRYRYLQENEEILGLLLTHRDRPTLSSR